MWLPKYKHDSWASDKIKASRKDKQDLVIHMYYLYIHTFHFRASKLDMPRISTFLLGSSPNMAPSSALIHLHCYCMDQLQIYSVIHFWFLRIWPPQRMCPKRWRSSWAVQALHVFMKSSHLAVIQEGGGGQVGQKSLIQTN